MSSRGALSLLALLIAACQSSTPPGKAERALITITSPDREHTDVITERQLRAALARLRFEREGRSLNAAPLPLELKLSTIDRLVERRILLLEAKRLGVVASTTAVARDTARTTIGYDDRELQRALISTYQTEEDLVDSVTQRLTVGRLLREHAHADVTVTDAEIEAAWAALPEEQRRHPARIRARQVVVVTEEEGKLAVDELKKGVPFAEVALKHSFAPEAARGGDLGWVEEAGLPAAFAPLFSLEIGRVSPLISTEYGFHLFRVEEREDARALTLDEVRASLRDKVLRAKLEKAEAAYVGDLVRRYEVTKDTRELARIE